MQSYQELKNELQHIIIGNGSGSQDSLIKAVQTYLTTSVATSSEYQKNEPKRAKEERALVKYIQENHLWYNHDKWGVYITEGAEQKVYFPENSEYVIKVADAVFYQYWIDYFNNLLVHNHLFPVTAYKLLGFHLDTAKLFAVLRQPFIVTDKMTKVEHIREFLLANGFLHKKNNDYYHPVLGVILEDVHDENVLTCKEVLFFIDTVFYLTNDFYK